MKKTMVIAGSCLFVLVILFFGTDPNKVPSFVLVLPFLLLFTILLYLIAFLLEKRGFSNRKSLRIAVLCAGVPIVLLVLQSIGQLTLRDVLVLSALFILSYFYMSRSTASS